MSALRILFENGGVHLPELGLWLDSHFPQLGPEKVFVSHAHSDHVAEHREVILSAPTSRLMQARVPGRRLEHVMEFGASRIFAGLNGDFEVQLVPAGHIFGSAMCWLKWREQTFLYTGDFKLRRGLSAEPCQPVHADVLIMETTFGRPQYQFPPTNGVLQGIIRFCREALDNDETPVLLGYSLGKSQELLCSLGDAGFPLMLHGAVYRLTRIYEQFGQCFPKYEPYEAGSARGKVLLCPPNVINSAMLRNLGKTRTAIVTGWAVDPNCRYRYQCDAAFPLSDHADFPDLVEFVRRVSPNRIYTLHGFAADFAHTLRDMGYDAQALSEHEQMALALGKAVPRVRESAPDRAALTKQPPDHHEQPDAAKGHLFHGFAVTCSRICEERGKLEKCRLLSEYLAALKGQELALAATWFTGRPFGPAQNKVMQLGWAVLRDAFCRVAAVDESLLHQIYLKHSDLGETAFELLDGQGPDQATLTLFDIEKLFRDLHAARGPLGKIPILTKALEKCTALEAKYLVKIITGDLRIGLKEGLLEDAVALAFSRPSDTVRNANLLLGDVGETAVLAAEDRLADAALVPFRPMKFMLASPEPTAADIWERVLESHENATGSISNGPPPTAWIEDKYDGIRCQLHKAGLRASLYSRDLKDITGTFPELADAARALGTDFVLDGEIVAMRGEKVLPFSELQKRLGRKEGDLFMREEVPIRLVAFDLLWLNGTTCLKWPLRERRAALEKISPLPAQITLAKITPTSSAEEIDAAFQAARDRGNEGLMIKDPESCYTPGRRGLAWLKLKKALATLDCVVVGAEFGHGKRNKVLSDYTFAVRDENTGELKVIGKAYTGLTDAEIAELTQRFQRTALRQHGRYFEVPPEVVLEVAFDRLQPSTRHSSGLAMRFPRIIRIRTDKSAADIDTVASARRLVASAL